MFKRKNSMDGKMESVGVKLIGAEKKKGALEANVTEQISEDPKREIEIIQKFYANGKKKHIIQLYDG
jgi:hypothetical protein